jgi:hypothetical protein
MVDGSAWGVGNGGRIETRFALPAASGTMARFTTLASNSFRSHGRRLRRFAEKQNRILPMKKTEILRFRSDADTLAALKDLCQQSGRSLSDVLRDSLLRELAHREGGARGGGNESRVFGRTASCADGRDRLADVDVLSTLLIGCRSRPGAWEAPEQLQRKHREVSRLIEALLRTLDPSFRSAPQAAVGDAFLEKKLRDASGDSSVATKPANGYASS